MFKPKLDANTTIDYRLLLIKYIHHIGMMEGVSFIDNEIKGMTEAEIKELQLCEDHSSDYYYYLKERV